MKLFDLSLIINYFIILPSLPACLLYQILNVPPLLTDAQGLQYLHSKAQLYRPELNKGVEIHVAKFSLFNEIWKWLLKGTVRGCKIHILGTVPTKGKYLRRKGLVSRCANCRNMFSNLFNILSKQLDMIITKNQHHPTSPHPNSPQNLAKRPLISAIRH